MGKELQKTQIEGIAELTEWGKFATQSGILPAGVTAMQAMAIIQTGKELGVPPMSALRTMAFVSGRLVLTTQLMLALARREGVEIGEVVSGDNSCKVTLKRGTESVTCEWTMEMARKANLTTKSNWTAYPAQMLRWRATCDALRLIAPDFVMGLVSKEEAEDLQPLFIPVGLDPDKAIPAGVEVDTISKEQRIKVIQEMTKNGWIKDGQMTPKAVEKLGELGYQNSQQIPKAEFDRVLKTFSEKAEVEVVNG